MRFLKDPERHKMLEKWLAEKLVSDIKATLEGADIKGALLKRLVGELAVVVADKWEGVRSSRIEVDGEEIAPFLVFGVRNDDEDVIVRNYDEMGSFLQRESKAAWARAFNE